MKKLTSNTFTKGLLKDFHPLTVGNDVMTDALNATIITMNGNEGILQNDMGNGRVESAFLPAGYVPVGMKEYGGIIYVASYNPVTNKGLIGSFPSPERNIDQSETGDPEKPLQLLDQAYIRLYKYGKFNSDNDLPPLLCQKGIAGLVNKTDIFGKDRYMRAGDKFGFYFDDYDNQNHEYNDGRNKRPILSNYFLYDYKNSKPYDTDNEQINVPSGDKYKHICLWDSKNLIYRNNIITLSTQILDVNNNLRDITELLKRFNESNEKIDTKDIKSKVDIFNSGYFINDSENKDWDPVNIERNKKSLNTYNNKLYGKMFLVGKANTLEYIENGTTYTSHSSETTGKYIEIVFNVNYFYNCPEDYLYEPILYYFVEPIGKKHVYTDKNCQTEHKNVESSDPIVNENPNINENPSVTIYGTKDELNNQEYFKYNLINEIRTVDYGKDEYSNAEVIETYDPITNLYKRTYQIRCETTFTEGYLHYVIVPRMKNIPGYEGNETNFGNKSTGTGLDKITIEQLTHLAIEGTIDFSKIGTGFNDMLYWNYRYLETIDGAPYMQLRWGLDDYLLTSDEISDLKMEFFSLNEYGALDNYDNTKFTTILNPELENIINTWDRYHKNIESLSNTGLIEGSETTSKIQVKPQYTINVSDKYSYTGPFMEYLYLNETELKKRHIYIVKLSRIKNGQYEFLAYRILITTSIYNDLFSGKEAEDDYCANNETVKGKITDRNRIKFDLDIIESNSQKSKLEREIPSLVYWKDGDGWKLTNEPFKEFILKEEAPDNLDVERLLVEYYKYVMNSTIDIKLHIPEKYPFSIKEEYFQYDNIKLKQLIENEYDKYPEKAVLPILDTDTPLLRQAEYKLDGEVYNAGSTETISKHNFTLETTTYFPSVMTYKYSDQITKITPKYIYKNLIEYIMDEINYTGYFPIVGTDNMNGKTFYCWVDLGYFTLDKNSKVSHVSVYVPTKKSDNEEIELFNEYCEKAYTYKKYRLFDSTNVNKFLISRPTSNFKLVFLFASPLIFDFNSTAEEEIGLHSSGSERDLDSHLYSKFEDVQLNISQKLSGGEQLNYLLGDQNDRGAGACNIFLREKFDGYLNQTMEYDDNKNVRTESQGKRQYPNYSYWSWAYIVWRGYGDTFFILNKMLYRNTGKLNKGRGKGPTTALWRKGENGELKDLINEIFNKLWHVYFRRDNGYEGSPTVLQLYPYYPISYNLDYTAKSCTEITVPGVSILSGKYPFYYYLLGSDGKLILSEDGTPKTQIEHETDPITRKEIINLNSDALKLSKGSYKLPEEFLKFEPLFDKVVSTTKKFLFKIPEVLYVNTLGLNIDGLILHKVTTFLLDSNGDKIIDEETGEYETKEETRIYIRDIDGYSLSDDFYNIAEGDVVENYSAMDPEIYDFVNHFGIRDNHMVVRLSYAEASDSNKVYMGCATLDRRMILEIGGCQYIELPDWRTIPTQQNYYTLFGNRTAYYGSGSGGGARTNPEIPWSGEGGKSAYGQTGGGGSRTGGRVTWELSVTDN